MKNKLSFLLVLILVFCSFGVIGCTSKNDIIGTWVRQSDDYVTFFIFQDEGKLTQVRYINSEGYKKETSITEIKDWEQVKGNVFKFNTFEWKLSKNKLIRITNDTIIFEKIDSSIEEYIENLKNA